MESQKQASTSIRVFCRFRPFNRQQLEARAEKIHRIAARKQLIVKDPNRGEEMSFMFDTVFDTDSTQQQIYTNVGAPILSNILDGFNGTIMAYGQTSSGKTHTMQGHDINDKDIKGLIPRMIENLFIAIEKSAENLQFKLKVSIFQLYMEKIRDLLDVSKSDLKIRENKTTGPYVENLTQAYISDKVQLYKLIFLGQKNRAQCTTNMNAVSSRSHMIFLLTLNQFNLETSQAKTSKLFLIDLAGSEKVSKTGAEGKVLEQAKKINLSLTSLGMVIKSLSQGNAHVPYRDSKLTRVIKDSLGGNSKTTLIVTCSPHQMHISETISTLRFGQNAQKVKNKPKINRELTVPQLQKMIEQLEGRIEQKDMWIKILEDYVKNQLNAPLPKNDRKVLMDKQLINQTAEITDEIKEIQLEPLNFDDINGEEKQECQTKYDTSIKKQQKMNSTNAQKTQQLNSQSSMSETNNLQIIKKSGTMPSLYNDNLKPLTQRTYNYEHIASLQTELESYKQNLQSELNKFYQLKKQYNSLNQNLKQLIQENINYQEKEKQYEQRLAQQKEEISGKFRSNCGLILGEIVNTCKSYAAKGAPSQQLSEKIIEIIDKKAKALCFQSENIDAYDYWKSEKETINKKMQQVIDKSMLMQKKLDKKQETNQTQEQRKQLQNRKIIEVQQKLDSLYSEYQKMLQLQTNWKVQCQLYERKLKLKQEKIKQLRAMLEEIQQQMQIMTQQHDDAMSVNTKIVKPLKGGFLFR